MVYHPPDPIWTKFLTTWKAWWAQTTYPVTSVPSWKRMWKPQRRGGKGFSDPFYKSLQLTLWNQHVFFIYIYIYTHIVYIYIVYTSRDIIYQYIYIYVISYIIDMRDIRKKYRYTSLISIKHAVLLASIQDEICFFTPKELQKGQATWTIASVR